MITTDKNITTAEYWDRLYQGLSHTSVDNSNTKRPVNSFDRFGWVAKYADGPNVLEVAAGHAHVSKRIKAAHPDWVVYASDQAEGARKVANCEPYYIFSVYQIPFDFRVFNTVIACQCLEYMDDLPRFFTEARRISEKLLITIPIGEMSKWSQLYIFTEQSVRELLEPYGVIEVFEREGDLLLVKLKFT